MPDVARLAVPDAGRIVLQQLPTSLMPRLQMLQAVAAVAHRAR